MENQIQIQFCLPSQIILNHCILILGTKDEMSLPSLYLATNLLAGSAGYMKREKNKEKWKIINIDYSVGVKKVNQKGDKRHRSMPGNEERGCRGVLGEGNKAIVGNK